MKRKLTALWILVSFTLLLPPFSFGEPETRYYSDRFVFRSKEVDDLTLVILNFSRGKEGEKYYGEFFGAVFTQTGWWFLEGNDKYFYKPGNLEIIQPSYFAKADGFLRRRPYSRSELIQTPSRLNIPSRATAA